MNRIQPAKRLVKNNPTITILKDEIFLSFLNVRAFEINKKFNNVFIIKKIKEMAKFKKG